MRTCLIITGGEYAMLPNEIESSFYKTKDKEEQPVENKSSLYIIACDSGYRNASKMNLIPDIILGDFDSAMRPEHVSAKVLTFPTRKDDMDTMLAVKHAISEDFRDIHIACAFGGRLDHAFSNIQAGAYIASRGGIAHLYGKNEEAVIFGAATDGSIAERDKQVGSTLQDNGETQETVTMHFPKKEGFSLSVFSLSDTCEGVTIQGTKYEVNNVTVFHNDPVGTSNVWASGDAVISLRRGTLMVMQSRLTPGEHI